MHLVQISFACHSGIWVPTFSASCPIATERENVLDMKVSEASWQGHQSPGNRCLVRSPALAELESWIPGSPGRVTFLGIRWAGDGNLPTRTL